MLGLFFDEISEFHLSSVQFTPVGWVLKKGMKHYSNTTQLYRDYMDVSKNNGTPKSFHFNMGFHYKPSILGVFPLFLETSIWII